MKYRKLGRRGPEVSEIGFGTWSMGGTMWGPSDDRQAIRSIHLALDLGVNFFDTAYAYGDGHSEKVLSRAFLESSHRPVVATKVPPKNMEWPADHRIPVEKVFPGDWIRECTEQSLRNLGADRVDLQQLHVWSDSWMDHGDWLEAVRDLKESGKIRLFGVSVNDHQPGSVMRLVRSGLVDCVQVIYNIFDQSPEKELLPACRELGVGVIVRVPLDEGGLSGKLTRETVFTPEDWRNRYFQGERLAATVERAERLRFLVREGSRTLPQAALKFCLDADAVSTVIPGMRRIEHVRDNCRVSEEIPPLTREEFREVKKHAWERNFYDS